MHKLQAVLPRQSLVITCKALTRTHIDYGDIIYDQTYNDTFHQKMELKQYNAALATTGAVTGTFGEKL